MKAKSFTAIISTALLLTACGSHNHPKAVDKLEEAEAAALEKAPVAEKIEFADHGQPTMGGVGGATGANATAMAPVATTETTSEPAEVVTTGEPTQAVETTEQTADATATEQAEPTPTAQ